MIHNVMVTTKEYNEIIIGSQRFIIISNLREFNKGDVLNLMEYNEEPTGNHIEVLIMGIMDSYDDILKKGFIAVSICII